MLSLNSSKCCLLGYNAWYNCGEESDVYEEVSRGIYEHSDCFYQGKSHHLHDGGSHHSATFPTLPLLFGKSFSSVRILGTPHYEYRLSPASIPPEGQALPLSLMFSQQ
jgi:hypothetical protein